MAALVYMKLQLLPVTVVFLVALSSCGSALAQTGTGTATGGTSGSNGTTGTSTGTGTGIGQGTGTIPGAGQTSTSTGTGTGQSPSTTGGAGTVTPGTTPGGSTSIPLSPLPPSTFTPPISPATSGSPIAPSGQPGAGTPNLGNPFPSSAGTGALPNGSSQPAIPAQTLGPGAIPNDPDFIRPKPDASLDQLYPGPNTKAPYSASTADPALSDAQKKEAGVIPLSPIPASELLSIGGKLPPIKLEAIFNEGITLKQVLDITIRNNLPIRIQQAGYDSTRYLFLGALGRFLPDLTLNERGQQVTNQGSPQITSTYTRQVTLRYPVFQGGSVLYGSLVNFYRMRAAKNLYYASVNDALLDAYQRYYNLVLNQSLLQIRVKSVELSRTQLKLNEQLRDAGVGTNFAVYQSRTQLALDKQALLQQEVVFRQSALELSRVLNTSMAVNFIPEQSSVRELRLVDPDTPIEDLLAVTIRLRPELKQFEDLRLAANRNIALQQAPLYPVVSFFTTGTTSHRVVHGANNNSASSSNVGSVSVVSTGAGGSIGVNGNGHSFTAGFDITWNMPSMGVPTIGNTFSARALARQALLQANQTYINTILQVRSSYLNMLSAREQVQVAAEGLVSSSEQLRLANLRVAYGQGINLELIQAQQAYVTALTNHLQAIIAYDISQAQLLHDTGQISIATLTREIPRKIGVRNLPQ